jgi:hypothetical protein
MRQPDRIDPAGAFLIEVKNGILRNVIGIVAILALLLQFAPLSTVFA